MSTNDGLQPIQQSFTIPDEHYVHKVDLDCNEPYCLISHKTNFSPDKDVKLLIPIALAYYLKTHHCGSNSMREILIEFGRTEVRNKIKSILEIK